MKKQTFIKGLSRIFTDFFSGVLAWSMAYYLRPWTDLIPSVKYLFPAENLPLLDFFIPFVFFSCLGLVLIFSTLGLYKYPAKYLTFEIFGHILWGLTLWMLSTVAVYSLVFHEHIFSRIMLAHSLIFTLIFSLIFRGILRVLFEKIFRGKKSICIIGDKKQAEKLQKTLENSEYQYIEKIFFPENITNTENSRKNDEEVLLQWKTILKKNDNISEIFFFEGEGREKVLREIRSLAASTGKVLRIIPAYTLDFWGHTQFEIIRGIPVLTNTPFRENQWWFFGKRVFDTLFSLFFLAFFSPVFLLIAVAIKIESRSWKAPVFYISQRVGKNGKLFWIWKFRSMEIDADKNKKALEKLSHRDGPLFKIKNDPRITRVGKFIRKTSLDEIPQFINVLKGEMSVIGPRPHLESEVKKYSSVQKRVLASKPGISGLAQVSGRSDLSFEEEIFLDSFYTENANFFLDAKIFLKTPFVLLFGKGSD
jgi:exopolysaccharide biosynthesis polyprenyl glycosylphosphotransferase